MKYVKLGNSGLAVSRIALGMMSYGTPQWRPWILDEAASRPIVQRAVELGINYFDTADMYSAGQSEVLTGQFVREFCRRDEAVIATKVFYPVEMAFKGGAAGGTKPPKQPNSDGLSRKRILHAVDQSLARLGTDYIDLYQIHRFDYETPLEETMEALHDIVKAGKVRYLGASSMAAWQFAKAQQIARENGWTPFVSMQNHYNLAYREEEREMIPLCRDQGVAVIPWSPLARGFLSGRRKTDAAVQDSTQDSTQDAATLRARTDDVAQKYYCRDSDARVLTRLGELAARRNLSHATLAYTWLLHKNVTAPVIGATQQAHVEDAVAAIDVNLSADEIAELEAPYEPHPVIGHS
ncbi:aldo/keto reductase [Paraburkholderia sp. Ac-20336]|uniref:aldo/keto reductase n=1 Tax=unclassified Paraburkholderia TaxID=2615204 RepID=UPI00198191C8|nr:MULTISPECIES: aldo/keto reductase [unclassified Paraburkholderia]MBN3803265.1 aldo/keto reductase [Paraburkholderia sp. Ac-20336]MBN3846849.1 aldo/keto reductase [Paraburkholderia sp. Ac-20342]